mmetsp:Transcript_34916/g.30772  ORF Transcript_34916/g.30772 Transcript_34916/m.30772 type:complete len:1110 (+) Transcript_34916:33-3362(+)
MSQSQEEFEVLPSQPSDEPINESKEIDDNESNDNDNNESNNFDNNPSNTNLIASAVVLSQSVSSMESSQQENQNDDENEDDNGAINNNIHEAMESPLIEEALINNNNQSPSPPPSPPSSHPNPNQSPNDRNRMIMDDEKDQSEELNIDLNMEDSVIKHIPNNLENDDNSNPDEDISDSDMNCEDSPAVNLNASAIIVNHANNNQSQSQSQSQNNNQQQNENENENESKEKEEVDEGNDNEGSLPPEGNVNEPNINNNDRPIVSNLNNNTTPKQNRKIYDNPYLNGNRETPGGDDNDNGNDNDQHGEESDEVSSDDDENDIMQQPNFTLGDDESDEEKDNDNHNHNKNQQKPPYQQPPQNKKLHSNPPKTNSFLNTSMTIISIVCCFIAYYYGIYNRSTTPTKPDPPKFHCPSSIIYVPLDGKEFRINASHMDHPSITTYEWDVVNMMEHDDLFVDGEDTESLLLDNMRSPGTINIDLSISSNFDNIYVFNKQCSIKAIFHEAPYFGIDLGTTYSCIAYQERQSKQRETKIVVADKHRAEYCVPTAVYFPPNSKSTKVIIGEDALKKLAIDPLNVIYDVKRIVGRKCNDPEIASFQSRHEFNVTCNDRDDSPSIFVPNLGKDGKGDFVAPEQVLAVILAHLVEIASKEFGVPYIRDVVVSIPALFHNGQRKAIHSACSLVGLNVRQLTVEPTAAALAYSYYSSTPADNFKLFLTFDMGGGTIDCSVLRCTGVDCQVLGVKGNSSLGGIDFDYIIRDMMIEKYQKQHLWNNIRTSSKLMAKFLKVAERVKKSLSVSTQHQVTMTNDELLKDDYSTFYTEKKQIIITRQEFEQHPRTKELIDSAIQTAKAAINTDRIKASNIRMILMIGGTTKIPIIQQRLREEFGIANNNINSARQLKLVFPSDDPQLQVVKGSAIIGSSLAFEGDSGVNTQSAVKQIVLEDVIPLSLGFSICITDANKELNNKKSETKCGVMDVIIEKNSHYPTRAEVTYCQKDPNSSIAKLDLYEGENEFVKDNYLLSHLSISNIPKREPTVCDAIIVEFIIDKNGIATIEAIVNDKNKKNRERQKFSNSLSVVSNDGNLSGQDIQELKERMIEWFKGHESIQNALSGN